MHSDLSVRLIANAGVLLCGRGVGILVDGLFREAPPPFCAPDAAVRERLLCADAPYQGVDYLFFTHEHSDHYDEQLTVEYLRRHPVRGVFLPQPEGACCGELLRVCAALSVPCRLFPRDTAETIVLDNGVTVQIFFTRHLGAPYARIPHICLLVSFGEHKLLLTVDTDYTHETFPALAGVPLRAVFLNPLFFSALEVGKFFRGNLMAQQYLVYHIPSDTDAVGVGMRAALARSLNRWDAARGRAVRLESPAREYLL